MLTLQAVRELALSLPEAVEQDHRGRPSFRVRGKTFATLHPEDGRAVLKLAREDQAALVEASPDVFSLNAWSHQGWTHVELAKVGKAEFAEILGRAWRGVAPKRLAEIAAPESKPRRRRGAATDAQTARGLALALPDANERPCYGTPGFYRGKTLFARLLEDGESIVVKIDFGEREALCELRPDTFIVTPHYRDYAMMIVRLATVKKGELAELLEGAWRRAAPAPKKRRAR